MFYSFFDLGQTLIDSLINIHERACSSYMREVRLHDSAGMTNRARFQTCLNSSRIDDKHVRGTFTLSSMLDIHARHTCTIV